jgi:hypothetical protein
VNPFVKDILDLIVKPPAQSLLTELTAQQTPNIAAIEATVGQGGTALASTVSFFVGKVKSTSPIVQGLLGFANMELPTLEAELSTELGTLATADVPTLYAAGLTWLTKVVGEL